MLLRRVVAPYLQANCYVLAADGARSALVVDPGAGSAAGVAHVLEELGLTVAAVLATHGHPDHVWEAAAVAGDTPVYIAAPDMHRLDDPAAVRRPDDPDYSSMLTTPWVRPADVRELPAAVLEGGGAQLEGGLVMRVVPAPGHTEGSTLTLLGPQTLDLDTADAQDVLVARDGALGRRRTDPAPAPETPVSLALSGDVVFRSSVGRTDLLGGDAEVMDWTLRTLAAVIDPATVLLPGHGPATWWGRELQLNPFVREALARA